MRAAYIRPGSRQAAIAAASVGAAVDVAYVLLMQSQGIEFGPRVVFYTAFVAVMAALSLASAAVGKLDERFALSIRAGRDGIEWIRISAHFMNCEQDLDELVGMIP